MVVQEKKQKDEIKICVDLRKLNDVCIHHPFPTPFTDEVLDNVTSQEAYSFTDGFSRYHQIRIVPEDRRKSTFATEWGCVQYIVMWLLFSQEYDFEVVVKLGRLNVGIDHLSRIETGEEPTSLEEGLSDVPLFAMHVADGNFEYIIHFLTTGTTSEGYSVQ
eukprot:PITA_30319